MIPQHLTLACALALSVAATAMAQDLAVYRYTTAGAPMGPSGWTTATTEDVGAVKFVCEQNANEFTMFFVHTTIDEQVAGSRATEGVLTTYPYLRNQAWYGNNPYFNTPEFTVANPGMEVRIPPWRIAAQVRQYLLATEPDPSYGRSYPGSTSATPLIRWSGWPSLPAVDEREPWRHATWLAAPEGLCIVNVASLGKAAAIMQAHQYAPLVGVPPTQGFLNAFGNLLDSTLGFNVLVQAVHVSRPLNQPPQIRFTQHNTLRRRSLHQLNPWTSYYGGAHLWVPLFNDANVNVYLAPRGAEMHVLFPFPVSGLRAQIYVPVPGSQPLSFTLQTIDQLVNPMVPDGQTGQPVMLNPAIARFPFPATAGNQVVFFINALGAGVAPQGHYLGGALVSSFEDPEN